MDKDNRILAEFIQVYCKRKHGDLPKTQWKHHDNIVDLGIEPPQLCEDCSNLLSYSIPRRALCPQNP